MPKGELMTKKIWNVRAAKRPGGTSYTVTSSKGKLDVVVTSGAMEGKTIRLIPTAPSVAYFNEPRMKKPA